MCEIGIELMQQMLLHHDKHIIVIVHIGIQFFSEIYKRYMH